MNQEEKNKILEKTALSIMLGTALNSISDTRISSLESVRKFTDEFLYPRCSKRVNKDIVDMCIETILLPSPQEVVIQQKEEMTMDEACARAIDCRVSELHEYILSNFDIGDKKVNIPVESQFLIFNYLKDILSQE